MADEILPPTLSDVPDFDPTKAPIVNPVTVRRVNEGGFPTQYALDWEQSYRNWMINTAVDLQTKITTVRNETADGFAEVTNEMNAIVNEQGAMAEDITNLKADFNGLSANGSVEFRVMSTPAGAAAAYGIYLTAGSSFTGLQMIAYSGGGSAIAFNANQFMLNDSGTAQNVFNYSSGVFTFNVPVRIRTGDIIDGAVSTTVANSGNPTAEVTVTDVTDGARVRVMGIYEGDTVPKGGVSTLYVVRIWHNGSVVKTVPMSTAAVGSGSSSVVSYLNTTVAYVATLPAGTHSFSVDCTPSAGFDIGITKNFYIEATVLKR